MKEEISSLLDLFVKDIKNSDLSPFERYLAVYIIVTNFKTFEAKKNDIRENEDIERILVNDYIDCYGYVNFLVELLKRVGIFALGITAFVYLDIEEFKKHGMTLVYLKDEKYKIDGFYMADASCDNSYRNIHFENALLIPKKTDDYYDKHVFQEFDILKVATFKEFLQKICEYPNAIEVFLNILRQVDINFYNSLGILKSTKDEDFYLKIYLYIVKHTNKVIKISEFYDAYGKIIKMLYPDLSQNEIDDMVINKRIYSYFRRSQFFDLEKSRI